MDRESFSFLHGKYDRIEILNVNWTQAALPGRQLNGLIRQHAQGTSQEEMLLIKRHISFIAVNCVARHNSEWLRFVMAEACHNSELLPTRRRNQGRTMMLLIQCRTHRTMDAIQCQRNWDGIDIRRSSWPIRASRMKIKRWKDIGEVLISIACCRMLHEDCR